MGGGGGVEGVGVVSGMAPIKAVPGSVRMNTCTTANGTDPTGPPYQPTTSATFVIHIRPPDRYELPKPILPQDRPWDKAYRRNTFLRGKR